MALVRQAEGHVQHQPHLQRPTNSGADQLEGAYLPGAFPACPHGGFRLPGIGNGPAEALTGTPQGHGVIVPADVLQRGVIPHFQAVLRAPPFQCQQTGLAAFFHLALRVTGRTGFQHRQSQILARQPQPARPPGGRARPMVLMHRAVITAWGEQQPGGRLAPDLVEKGQVQVTAGVQRTGQGGGGGISGLDEHIAYLRRQPDAIPLRQSLRIGAQGGVTLQRAHLHAAVHTDQAAEVRLARAPVPHLVHPLQGIERQAGKGVDLRPLPAGHIPRGGMNGAGLARRALQTLEADQRFEGSHAWNEWFEPVPQAPLIGMQGVDLPWSQCEERRMKLGVLLAPGRQVVVEGGRSPQPGAIPQESTKQEDTPGKINKMRIGDAAFCQHDAHGMMA